MRILFLIALGSCVVLLGSAILMWRNLHQPVQEVARVAPNKRKYVPKEHPRLDLAAGLAPSAQAVRTAARRTVASPGMSLGDPALQTEVSRLDRAFAKDEMGDLSDPDHRRPPAGGVRRPMGTLSVPESR